MDKKIGKLKRIMLRRSLGILLAFAMVFGTLPISGITVSASENRETLDTANSSTAVNVSVKYQKAAWDESKSEAAYTEETVGCIPVDSAATEWNAGWYVVNSSVAIAELITVSGAVNLILFDNCILTAGKGIVVPSDASLTIYAQSGGSGTLNATGTVDSNHNASAGIGGSTTSFDSGAITIHGGVINAAGGGESGFCGAAGIGGGTNYSGEGDGGNSGEIVIYGGTITAAGGSSGAGIGGGSGGVNGAGGAGSNITIYGGSVTARSTGTDMGGAGIGGGSGTTGGGVGSKIAIYGGTVTAVGGNYAAGIGGGGSGIIADSSYKSGDGTNITISGGRVTAVGGNYAAGIGGGGGYNSISEYGSSGCTGGAGAGISITGGIVDASSPKDVYWKDYKGAPIGSGGNTSSTAGVTKTAGIIFENGIGTVYGPVTLTEPLDVPDGYTLPGETGVFYGNYAFYKDGRPIVPTGEEITGPFTLKECGHEGVGLKDLGSGMHGLQCPYCGCAESHETTFTAAADGSAVTLSLGCDTEGCGYREIVGSVDFTFPKAAYGQTGQTVAWTAVPAGYTMMFQVEGEALYQTDGEAASITLKDLFGSTEMTVKKHNLSVYFCDNTTIKISNTCVLTFDVDKAPLTADMVTLDETKVTYNGTEQKPAITVKQGNDTTLTAGTDYDVSCTRGGAVTTDLTSAGTVTVTIKGRGNYEGEVEETFTIQQAAPDVGTVTAGVLENTLDVTQAALNRTNQTPAGTLTLTDSTLKYGTNTYTWEFAPADAVNYKTVTGEVEITVNDTIAPTGEIGISTNHWNSILHTITYELFLKKTEQITITAGDKESGVASVSYYISDSGLTEEEVKKLDNWTAGNTDKITFRISQNESCVVYAKITDHQGNVTYISSDGLVFDGTCPSITGVTDGETYCTPQTVTVTDDNLESVTVNGKEETLSDNKFTLDVKFDTTNIVIAAADKAGNVTTVTVNAGHNYGTEWKSDSNGHWHECVVCGDKSEVPAHTEGSGSVTKPATETETGFRTYKCSVCGYETRTEIIEKLPPSHTHICGTEWKSDASSHWHECFCGDKSDTAAHTEDGGSVIKAPTETEKGVRTYKCSICGYVMRMEEIEKLPPSHTHSYGTEWKSDAGSHWHECTCGDKSDSAAHTEDGGSVTKAPAETEKGVKTYKCSVCGYVMRTEEIELKPADNNNSGGSSDTGTASRQPFIKDSSGREGWDVIRAEAEKAAAAPAGGIVAVDMNGAVSVPGSIFAAVRGKDVTLCFDMGGGITWSVDGKDITAETAGDTDFSVKTEAGAIPEELIAEKAGGLAHLELRLAHEGAFGFTAALTLRIVSKDGNGITAGSSGTAAGYTGMYANLFYYNPDLRSLEFICADKIGENGTADLPFVHASDYTVILSAGPMGGTGTPENPQEPVKQAGVESVKLSKTLYTYNGKAKKPSVIAMDTEGRKISGKYYTVSYKNNKKAGKATAIVKFKGGCSGTVKKTFTIRPAGTSIKKAAAVPKGFTVKWKKKTAQTSGYQIQYSANAGFKGSSARSVFVKKNSTVKKTVKNLKAGKKYYVRIRTYKTVKADGKSIKIYSTWSKGCKVKTLPAASEKETASSARH